jgi:PAS domain S-box-containing protein
MAKPDQHVTEPAFLRGGGASAALIANHDWSQSPLGPPERWPQSLRSAVSIVLNAPMPMMLMWGKEGATIYNDAEAEVLRPYGLPPMGRSASENWPDLAGFLEPVIAQVLTGRSLEYRDQKFTLKRGARKRSSWYDLTYSPVLDEDGRPAGVLAIAAETTERVLSRRRAAVAAERRRRFVEQSPGFVCVVSGPEFIVTFVNSAQRRLFGDRDAVGKPLAEVFPEFSGDERAGIVQRVYATGERVFRHATRVMIRKPGATPEEHFVDVRLEPITNIDARVKGVFIEGFDVTEQVRAQAAVRDSERRLGAALSVARLGAFEWNLETGEAILDVRGREIFDFRPDEPLTLADVVGRIDKEDLPRILRENTNAMAAARTRGQSEYRIHLRDGTTRNIASVSDALLSKEGRRTRMIGVFADVTELRRGEKRQQLLINELNHRVKNTLATVQSIAAQTLRTAPDVTRAREAFESRLVALAAAHDILTAQSWHGARLDDVVDAAMAPFEGTIRPRIQAFGPPIWLNAQHALALTLALHELATNASKYGALSAPDGQVTIRWAISPDTELSLSWREDGGPAVTAPSRAGFGTRLLQRGLAQELRGEVTFSFPPQGVQCQIRCRLGDTQADLQPEFAALWAKVDREPGALQAGSSAQAGS